MAEKAYEKHAWILLFAIGVMTLLLAVPLLFGVDPGPTTEEGIIGMTFSELEASNPRFFDLVTYYLEGFGLDWLVLGFLIIAISVTAYRRGEKWAWYAFWSLPAYYTAVTASWLSAGAPLSEASFLMLPLIMSLLGLLLPYRKFFPSK